MRGLLFGAALAAMAGTSAAESLRYDCRFATGTARDGNWIPSVLVLHHDPARGRVVVFDPVIRLFVGRPIEGRLDEQTRQRRTFSWRFDARMPGDERRSAAMAYRFSWYADGRRARMSAMPSGFDNTWESDGTCTLAPGGRAPTAARP